MYFFTGILCPLGISKYFSLNKFISIFHITMFPPPYNNIAPTTDRKAVVKLRVNNNKLMIETGTDRTKLPATKGYVQFVIPMKWEMKFTFSAIAPNILLLEMKFSPKCRVLSIIYPLQIHYSVPVIKLMNSEDSYLNLRLTNYISLLNNLRDSVLPCKNHTTWVFVIDITTFCNTVGNYSHANKGYYCCCCCYLSLRWPIGQSTLSTQLIKLTVYNNMLYINNLFPEYYFMISVSKVLHR